VTGAAVTTGPSGRWAWAAVDEGVIESNVRVVRAAVEPAEVWAVVKADGYGHGAVTAARAATRGGATGLCVALVQEGIELRAAGIGSPVLVLSEQPPEQSVELVRHGLAATVYSRAQIAALVAAGAHDHPVHLKVDTGMHRVGCRPEDAVALAGAIAATGGSLRLEGVCTHLAVADEPDHPFTGAQLATFDRVLAALAAAGHRPDVVHAANSAGGLCHPAARRAVVRAGIAIYGIRPGELVPDAVVGDLRPAMSLHARVSHVQRVEAGEGVSYGLRHRFPRATTVATLPIGYADGVPRRLSAVGGEVLVGGVRRPIVGVVTMDQLMVDVGDDPVAVGDPAVLLGRQGDEEVRAEEWAHALGTIGYEITCGISRRIPRHPRFT